MPEPSFIKILNNCSKPITVHFRFPRPKKKSKRPPTSVVLQPRDATHPLPRHFLVGARGWDKLRTRRCVKIENVDFEPRFVQILNRSEQAVTLKVRVPTKEGPKQEKTLRVRRKQKSRIIDVRSIPKAQLNKLAAQEQISVLPVYDIGPTTGRGGAIGSYGDEDVYTCYECGGAIVFRGRPPRPVHI